VWKHWRLIGTDFYSCLLWISLLLPNQWPEGTEGNALRYCQCGKFDLIFLTHRMIPDELTGLPTPFMPISLMLVPNIHWVSRFSYDAGVPGMSLSPICTLTIGQLCSCVIPAMIPAVCLCYFSAVSRATIRAPFWHSDWASALTCCPASPAPSTYCRAPRRMHRSSTPDWT